MLAHLPRRLVPKRIVSAAVVSGDDLNAAKQDVDELFYPEIRAKLRRSRSNFA
jgi:hypothetical protein